jgi:hypothetical protein
MLQSLMFTEIVSSEYARKLDMVAKKPTNAHKFMKIYYKRSNTSYMFRPLMWPSSGRCVTKDKYSEMLQKLCEPMQCKLSNIKITRFKFVLQFKIRIQFNSGI